MAQPKIEKSNVVNFDCNGVVPPSQVEVGAFNYIYQSRVGDVERILKIFKSNHYLTFSSQFKDEIKSEEPTLTLPITAADWILKTRPRFGMPESAGWVPYDDSGFTILLNGEDISISSTPVDWDIINASRPPVDNYDDWFRQSLSINFDLFDRADFQAFLKDIAAKHPIQHGDVQLVDPNDYDYDYVK